MKVDKERMDVFLKKIEPKGCPLCGNNEWILSDYILSAKEYTKEGEKPERIQVFPMVPIICKNCGNTYFINAFIANLLDMEEDKTEGNKDE